MDKYKCRIILLSQHLTAPPEARWKAELAHNEQIAVSRSTHQEAVEALQQMVDAPEDTEWEIRGRTYLVPHSDFHPNSELRAYLKGERVRNDWTLTNLRNRHIESCSICQSRLAEIKAQTQTGTD